MVNFTEVYFAPALGVHFIILKCPATFLAVHLPYDHGANELVFLYILVPVFRATLGHRYKAPFSAAISAGVVFPAFGFSAVPMKQCKNAHNALLLSCNRRKLPIYIFRLSDYCNIVQNRQKGKIGEEIACRYLKNKGYEILYRNWHCRWGELDIIALRQKVLIFAEVKYRTSGKFGIPEDAITDKKCRHLLRTVKCFLTVRNKADCCWRFETVCILNTNTECLINHYKTLL